jgi:hypothetical protein
VFDHVVHVAHDGRSSAAACRRSLREDAAARRRRVEPLLRLNDRDAIAARMDALVREASRSPERARMTGSPSG